MGTTCRIACLPGDGIGPEIVPERVRVLAAVAEGKGFALEFETFPWRAPARGTGVWHGDC